MQLACRRMTIHVDSQSDSCPQESIYPAQCNVALRRVRFKERQPYKEESFSNFCVTFEEVVDYADLCEMCLDK